MKLLIFVLCAFAFTCCFAQQCTDVPVAKCKPNPPIYEIPLDKNGKYYFNTSDIDNGSSTTCPPLSLSLRNAPVNNTITCNSVDLIPPYPLTVFLLVSSAGSSQPSVCYTRYEVVDHIAPTAVCKNATVYSNAVLTADDIDGGSFDNCNIKTRVLNVTTVGACNSTVAVSLTVTDYSGNVAQCSSLVKVVDGVAPEAKCKNSTQNVGETGSVTIDITQGYLIDNGSYDFCDGTNVTLSLALNGTATNFTRTCSSLGIVNVGLNVVDSAGNVGTCSGNMYFEDLTPPNAVCATNITIDVGKTGQYNLTAISVTGESNDTCGISSYGDDIIFDCADLEDYYGWRYYPGYGWRFISYYYFENITQTFYVTDNSFNQNSCEANITIVDNTPPTALCVDAFTLEVGSGYGYLSPYSINAGSSDICTGVDLYLDQNDFYCSDIGVQNIKLTVYDRFGNNETCTTPVTFVDNYAPNTYCNPTQIDVGSYPSGIYTVHPNDTYLIDGGSYDYCSSITTTLNIARNLEITCNLLGVRDFTLYAEDIYGNIGTCSTYINFVDETYPTLVCSSTEELDVGNGRNHYLTSEFLMDGTTDACGVTFSPVEHVFNCSTGLGVHKVTSTATDPSGNAVSCSTDVTIADLVEPVPECLLNASLNVGATGTVTAVPSTIDAGSYDACTPVSLQIINSQTTFTCADIDVHDVVLQVSDTSSNIATCTAPLRIVDTTPPIAKCKTYVADVGAAPGGFVSLNINDGYLVDGGSTDVCTAQSDLVFNFGSPVTGSCATIGSKPATLFVTDEYGNQASCSATVTFADLTPPEVSCASLTIINVGRGPVTPVLSQIATASDICGPLVYSTADPTTYDCTQIGDHTFTIKVTDGAGNFASCSTLLRVQDNVPPTAQCSTFTLPVGTGYGILAPTDVNAASSDFCDPAPVLSIDKSNFTCADVGRRIVTLTVKDASNNTDTCQAAVRVIDNTIPVASCKNIVVDVGVNGSVTIPTTSGSLVDNGSYDICSGVSADLNQTYTGTCALGDQVATLIVKDDSGNVNTCTSTISFRDLTPPTSVCRAAVTIDVGSNSVVFNPSAGLITYYDTCDGFGTAISSNVSTLTCANIGSTPVQITVADPSGNTVNCTTTIIGEDHVGPNALCNSNVLIPVGSAGSATITAATIDAGSSDACLGPITSTINQTLITCAEFGTVVPIELSLLDQYGNPSSCIGTVLPQDTVLPVAKCRNIVVYLDNSGSATISPGFVDDGSFDVCTSPVSLALSKSTFNCGDIGTSSTTLTVTDGAGNVNTCVSTVTVIDDIIPVAKCSSIITSSAAAISAASVNAGSSDNCAVNSLSLSTSTFTNPIGGVTTLFVSDTSGNVDTCTAQVTIQFGILLTVQAGQPLASVSGFAEHIPFVISWPADNTVPAGTLVELGLINSENSFYYLIAKDVQFDRLKYVVQDGITDVTPNQDYLIVMYVPNKTNYASKGITLIRYPTNHP